MSALYPKFGIKTTRIWDASSGSIPNMGFNIVESLGAYVSARMKADPAIETAVKMANAAKLTKSTIHRVQAGSTAVSIDKLPGIASALKLKTWQLMKCVEEFGTASPTDITQQKPGEAHERLIQKIESAHLSGLLMPEHLQMLEAAVDSQLAKGGDPAAAAHQTGRLPAPSAQALIELRTVQRKVDDGSATAETVKAMNRRIGSRSRAERDNAGTAVVGDGDRRDKKIRR